MENTAKFAPVKGAATNSTPVAGGFMPPKSPPVKGSATWMSLPVKDAASRMSLPVKGMATIFILILLCTSLSCNKSTSLTLNNPESIVWNPVTNAYLISNKGSGQIFSLKDKKDYSLFNQTSLKSPKGMAIRGNTVYVPDVTQVVGMNLADGKEVFRIAIPGSQFLNDIDVAGDSLLYVSDTNVDRIIQINTRSNKYKLFTSKYMMSPNGVYFVKQGNNGILYIVSTRSDAPVLMFDTATEVFTEIPNTKVSQADGITRDNAGNWFVSSWQDKAIHQFTPDWSSRKIIKDNLTSPADIYFNKLTGELCVPQLELNKVIFFKPGEGK